MLLKDSSSLAYRGHGFLGNRDNEANVPSLSNESKDVSMEMKRLDSIPEKNSLSGDNQLFWFSYDEDLKNFPNGIRLEPLKFRLNSFKNQKTNNNRKDSVFSFKKPHFQSQRKLHERKKGEEEPYDEGSEESSGKTNTLNSLNNF